MINKNRLITTFMNLVKIDSPSGEEKAVAEEVARKLQVLGGKVEFDNFGNVIAKFKGRGEPIMLSAHLDTVEPGRNIKPIINNDRIISDGTTILGSDPKAGISIIIEAITSIKETGKSHLPINVILTREEESSLAGAINLDYKKISSKRGIVFDGDEEVHKLFVSSPGYYKIDAIIVGRSAHAGVEPEKGISAIQIAAKIVSRLKLGRLDYETTVNIGIIKGGSARNAVPEKVEIQGEIRSRNNRKLLKQVSRIKNIFKKINSYYPEAKINLEVIEEFQGFKLQTDHPTIQFISSVLKEMSLQAELKDSGGGSDANIFHQHGIEVVVVGTGVYEPHTTREYVIIPQMYQAAEFCEKVLLT